MLSTRVIGEAGYEVTGASMTAGWTKTRIAAILLIASAGQAATLYERDGITLEGTVGLVTRGAGSCQVLEERHPQGVYERMKANHGQPLHVWRLDFAARNGSGRWLEHLTANVTIASEWPPCTTWSGPEGTYPKPVQWADSFEFLQKPYGMAPGDVVSDTVFVLAFHDRQPKFERWNLDYRFAAGSEGGSADAVASSRPTGSEEGPAVTAGQLPPGIQIDLNLRKAEQAVRDGNAAMAREAMERVVTLERDHGLEPLPEDNFRYAEAWAAADEPQRAMESAVRYLQLQGRDAEHYSEALDLISREGSLEPIGPAGTPTAGRVGAGEQVGSPVAEEPQAGESGVFDGMEFVWVPAGEFLMGSDDPETLGPGPVTRVRISRGFWLGKYEVTQDQWQAVMGTNPSRFSNCGGCPVENVSWDDAHGFIRQLNRRAEGDRHRLPTQAEWEYAARAGTSGHTYSGNPANMYFGLDPVLDRIAWYDQNSGERTHPVGGKAPNEWGLHDMLGNVDEWVQDSTWNYPGGSVTDPRGTGSRHDRVMRGGSWATLGLYCLSSSRTYGNPGIKGSNIGFRLLRAK